eukprot:366550-Chlamydomonas_euryale.AAC.9
MLSCCYCARLPCCSCCQQHARVVGSADWPARLRGARCAVMRVGRKRSAHVRAYAKRPQINAPPEERATPPSDISSRKAG